MLHKQASAHKLSMSYLANSKLGLGDKDKTKGKDDKLDGDLNNIDVNLGSTNLSSMSAADLPISREPSPSQVKMQVYGDIVKLEDLMLEQRNNNYDQCRNGLKARQHPKQLREVFLKGVVDFDQEIKTAKATSCKNHTRLKKQAERATDYLKSAQCVQRASTRMLSREQKQARGRV